MHDEDIGIIVEVLKGNTDAYERIIDKYGKRVYGFVYRLLSNEHSAQDITQETFIRAYEKLKAFNLGKNFPAWLFAIAKNISFNYIKKNKRTALYTFSEDIDSFDEDNFSSDSNNPEQLLHKKQYTGQIISVIEGMPEKYRVLIYLKYVDELSYREISQKLGIPIDTVESRLYYARQYIIKKLDDSKNVGRQVKDKWTAGKQKDGFQSIQMEK